MISTTADHALRAVLVLARARGARLLNAQEIAEATGAPREYLAKTLHALARAGLVTSMRGPTGGFALTVAPERLTLAHVIGVFDERVPSDRCLLGDRKCDAAHPCAAHHRWTAVASARRAPLEATTVADLLAP